MTEWPGRPVARKGARSRAGSARRARLRAGKAALASRIDQFRETRRARRRPRPARESSQARFARRVGKSALALLSVIVLTLTWYGWQFIGNLSEGLATAEGLGMPAKPLDGAVDILLVGQDSRTDAHGQPLSREVLDMLHAGDADGERQTDTMVLVHIPQNGKRAVAVSFPRDSWVELAGGYGTHKLNSAFAYAYNDTATSLRNQGVTDQTAIAGRAKVAGRKNLVATIERFVGKPRMIDRYAEVNLASFYEVTKAIGGIDICLNKPVHEPKSGVDLPAGRQTVQGVQALAFVRQRYDLPNGDLDRIARQQAFLSGFTSKVLSPSVLTSPSKVGQLINAVKKSVVLSPGWNLLEFAKQMQGLTGGNVQFNTIPVEGNAVHGGADVMEVDEDAVRAFVGGLTSDAPASAARVHPEPTPEGAGVASADTVTVDVLNGSGKSLPAERARNVLRGNGFGHGADREIDSRSTTVVRYPPGQQAVATSIGRLLGSGTRAEPDENIPKGHVKVLIGRSYPGTTTEANGASGGGGAAAPAPSSSAAVPAQPPIDAGGIPCVN